MSDVNSVVECYEIVTAKGQAWKMSHVTPGVRGKFSALYKARARIAAREIGPSATAVLIEQMAAGAYNWGSPLDPDGKGSAISAALEQEEGKYLLIGMLLEPEHGELPPLELAALVRQDVEAFGEALSECLRLRPPGEDGAGGGKFGPNGKAPTEKTNSTPAA